MDRIRYTGIRNGDGKINPGLATSSELTKEGVLLQIFYFDDESFYADKGGRLEIGCLEGVVYTTLGQYPAAAGQEKTNVDLATG